MYFTDLFRKYILYIFSENLFQEIMLIRNLLGGAGGTSRAGRLGVGGAGGSGSSGLVGGGGGTSLVSFVAGGGGTSPGVAGLPTAADALAPFALRAPTVPGGKVP